MSGTQLLAVSLFVCAPPFSGKCSAPDGARRNQTRYLTKRTTMQCNRKAVHLQPGGWQIIATQHY